MFLRWHLVVHYFHLYPATVLSTPWLLAMECVVRPSLKWQLSISCAPAGRCNCNPPSVIPSASHPAMQQQQQQQQRTGVLCRHGYQTAPNKRCAPKDFFVADKGEKIVGRGNWGKAWSGLGQSAKSKADDSSKRPRTMIDGCDAWKATPEQESSMDVGGDGITSRQDRVAKP